MAGGLPDERVLRVQGLAASQLFDKADALNPINRRISIIVMNREAEDRFHLTVWRSFAPHVRALLDLARRELAAGL